MDDDDDDKKISIEHEYSLTWFGSLIKHCANDLAPWIFMFASHFPNEVYFYVPNPCTGPAEPVWLLRPDQSLRLFKRSHARAGWIYVCLSPSS